MSTISHLCQPLLRHLQSRPALHLATDRATLVALRQEIDQILSLSTRREEDRTTSSEEGEGGKSPPGETKDQKRDHGEKRKRQKGVLSSLVEVKTGAGRACPCFCWCSGRRNTKQKTTRASHPSPLSSSTPTCFMDTTAIEDSSKEEEEKTSLFFKERDKKRDVVPVGGGEGEEERGRKRKRGIIKRVMLAVRPYTELTLEEASLSTMERFYGRPFFLFWNRRCKRVSQAIPFTVFLFKISITYVLLLYPLSESYRTLLASSMIVAGLLQNLTLSSVSNFFLFHQLVSTYEAAVIMVESVLFSFGVAGVFCFSFSAFLLAFASLLSAFNSVGFNDSYRSGNRQKARFVYLLWSLFFFSLLVIVHLRLSPQMCSYRFDLQEGLLDEENPQYLSRRKSGWGLSIREFCLNRGFSLLLLFLRMTYTAFKYPHDCVILRSRIRILEQQLVSSVVPDEEGKEDEETKRNPDRQKEREEKNAPVMLSSSSAFSSRREASKKETRAQQQSGFNMSEDGPPIALR